MIILQITTVLDLRHEKGYLNLTTLLIEKGIEININMK